MDLNIRIIYRKIGEGILLEVIIIHHSLQQTLLLENAMRIYIQTHTCIFAAKTYDVWAILYYHVTVWWGSSPRVQKRHSTGRGQAGRSFTPRTGAHTSNCQEKHMKPRSPRVSGWHSWLSDWLLVFSSGAGLRVVRSSRTSDSALTADSAWDPLSLCPSHHAHALALALSKNK